MNNRSKEIALEIANNIIEIIETTQTLIWDKEWKGLSLVGGLAPRNYDRYMSGKPSAYQGLNILALVARAEKEGWDSPYFMTFKQAKKHGGSVRPVRETGHGTTISYWNFVMYDENDNKTKDPKKCVRKVPFLSKSTVFNAAQITGIDFPEIKKPKTKSKNEIIEAAEAIKDGYADCPPTRYGGDRAFYNSGRDEIGMPSIDSFNSSFSFYKTEFHEQIHSTGHKSRLGRDLGNGFGTVKYSKEELIAELGASFLSSLAGIFNSKQEKNSAAYIKSWLKVLKDDPTMILTAASKAQKAAEYILGCPLDEYEAATNEATEAVNA